MILDFSTKHHAGVVIIYYQEAMGKEFLEEIKLNIEAPWKDALFNTDDDPPLLSKQKSETFHTIAMKGSLLVKRSRPDSELGFGFLSSRAKSSTQHDWSKLAKIMSFMLGTKDEVLTLSNDDSKNLH